MSLLYRLNLNEIRSFNLWAFIQATHIFFIMMLMLRRNSKKHFLITNGKATIGILSHIKECVLYKKLYENYFNYEIRKGIYQASATASISMTE